MNVRSKSARPAAVEPAQPLGALPKAALVLGTLYLLSVVIVRCLPQAHWNLLAGLLARYQTRQPSIASRHFQRATCALLGDRLDDQATRAVLARNLAHGHRRGVFVAALRRRRGWKPSITLIGRETLETVRARGQGVILWFDGFAHATIIGKQAFANAGYSLWHVSAPGHGILNSPLAERFLNQRVIDVELRYLAGRIVFDPASAVAAMRQIFSILARNGIVSISNNAYIGKSLCVPFGSAELPLATTPLKLAVGRGVGLLPVSVIELEPFARYEVTVGPELKAPAGVEREDAMAAMAKAYAHYLLPLVRGHADQWEGWHMLRSL